MSSINNDMKVMISTDPNLNKYADRLKDSNLPMINFADYLVEQGIFSSREELTQYIRDTSIPQSQDGTDKPANGTITKGGNVNKKIPDDIAIAEFDLFSAHKLSYEITPTGDRNHDYQLQMGLNYNMSCVDDTNWQDYDKLTAEEDFTGMSAAEIYKTIYEKYQHCYGENFIDINAVPYVSANGSVDTFRGLISRFQRDVKSAIGSGDYVDIQKARREALYGDADDYDVRAAIIEKYAADGFTNADLYKITAEMDRCGVGGGIHNVLSSVLTKDRSQVLYNHTLGINTSVETACAMYEQMLASPLDTYMLDGIERHSKAMGAASSKLYSALDQLRETYGGYSGGISADSVSAAAQNAKDDFVWIKI